MDAETRQALKLAVDARRRALEEIPPAVYDHEKCQIGRRGARSGPTRTAPCGTETAYKRGCHCEACRAASKDARARRRARTAPRPTTSATRRRQFAKPLLTERQLDILRLSALGKDVAAIAELLNAKRSTVQRQRKYAQRSLAATSITQAVATAIRAGLLWPPEHDRQDLAA